nr:MAG TPA: hypothetical protein [Caudoviricetes sp.]
MRRIRLKTAAVTGSIDCALRLALRFIPPPFLRRGGGRVCLRLRLQTLFDGSVPALSRHPSDVGVLARSTTLSTRQPPLAIPTCEDRHLHCGLQSAH